MTVAITGGSAFRRIRTFQRHVTLATDRSRLAVTLRHTRTTARTFGLLFTFGIRFYHRLVATNQFFAFNWVFRSGFPAESKVHMFFDFTFLREVL